MSLMQDDELTLLWQQGTSAEPDPEEIARLAARASMRRFDLLVLWRNVFEYAADLLGLAWCGWLMVTGGGHDRALGLAGFACVAFVAGYRWWQHRDLVPLDPSADARVYQAAMLTRIDKQIRLLGSARYWTLPNYLWLLWWAVTASGVLYMAPVAGLYVWFTWINERWEIPNLRAERARIEALFEE